MDAGPLCHGCKHHRSMMSVCFCTYDFTDPDEEREHPGAGIGWREVAHDLFCRRAYGADKCPHYEQTETDAGGA